MFMMQLASEKHCWLADLDDIPSEEIPLWAAFYEIEEEKRKKAEKKADRESRRRRR